jgi:hypothetical protein
VVVVGVEKKCAAHPDNAALNGIHDPPIPMLRSLEGRNLAPPAWARHWAGPLTRWWVSFLFFFAWFFFPFFFGFLFFIFFSIFHFFSLLNLLNIF